MLVRTLNSRGKSEVSVFGGPEATMEHILTSVKKLQVAFPQMSRDFWNLLTERIVKNNIAAERLEYCLTRVIDNFTYKTLTIADVIGSDLKCTIYTYAEMLNQCDKNSTTTSDYAPVYFGYQKPTKPDSEARKEYKIPLFAILMLVESNETTKVVHGIT